MGLLDFLKGGKRSATNVQTAEGVVVTAMLPMTAESKPIIARILATEGTISAGDVNLQALKALNISNPFQRAVGQAGEQYRVENENVRVSLWYRQAVDGGLPAAEDMVLLREARNGNVFSSTHVVYGERARFAAAIIPPCCEGDSVLVTFTQSDEERKKIVQSPRALELGVADFFNNSVRFAVATTPQLKSMLVQTHQNITGLSR